MKASKHVLIVDDEPKVAFFLGRALLHSDSNYCVTIAHTGEEALKLLAHSQVELLITDLRMPGISGLELIRWVRASQPQTRAILITAYGNQEVEAEARYLSTYGYLTKPFTVQEFIHAVSRALLPSNSEQALVNEKRMRDIFLSLAFHELRVPLTYIMSYTALLAEHSTEPQLAWVHTVLQHALRMRAALDDFTLLSEWSVAHAPSALQRVDLHGALVTATAQLSSLALEREQSVKITAPPQPTCVETDAWLIGVLLTALVAGAIKHAPAPGRIDLEVVHEDACVAVCARASSSAPVGRQVTADVAADVAANVPGISLTVARKLAEAMGGELHSEFTPQGQADIRLAFRVAPTTSSSLRLCSDGARRSRKRVSRAFAAKSRANMHRQHKNRGIRV